MPLRGGLDDFSLPDLFQLIHFGRKSGTLIVTHGDVKGYVCFRNGDVYFASHNWKRRPLGQRLIEAGELDQAKLDEALELQNRSRGEQRIGRILIDLGYINRETLEEYVEEQIRDSVFNMVRWTEGGFYFDPEELCPDEDIGLSMSTDALIEEVGRRLDEWYRIEKKIPSLNAVFRVVDAPPEDASGLDLTRDEWLVLFEVDGKRSVKEIVEKAGRTAMFTCRAIYGLAAAGLITMAGGGATAPAKAEARLEAEVEEFDGRGAVELFQAEDTGDEQHGEGQPPDSHLHAAQVVGVEEKAAPDLEDSASDEQVADREAPAGTPIQESAPASGKRRREVHREQVWSEPEPDYKDTPSEDDTAAGGTPAPGQSLVDYYKSLALREMGDSDAFRQTEEKRATAEEGNRVSDAAAGADSRSAEVSEAGAPEPGPGPEPEEAMPVEWAGHLTRMIGRAASPPDSVMKQEEVDEEAAGDEEQAAEAQQQESASATGEETPHEPVEEEETFALEEPSAILDEPEDVFDEADEYPSGDDMEKMLQATPQPRGELSREELLAFDRPTYPAIETPDAPAPKEYAWQASANVRETVVEVIMPEPVLDYVATGEVAVAELLAVPVVEFALEPVPDEASNSKEPEFLLEEIPLVLGEEADFEPVVSSDGNGHQDGEGIEILGLEETPGNVVELESFRPAVAEELDFGDVTRTADKLAEVEAELELIEEQEKPTTFEVEAEMLEETAAAEAVVPAVDIESGEAGIIYAHPDDLDALREISSGVTVGSEPESELPPGEVEPLSALDEEPLPGDAAAGGDAYLDNMQVRGKRGAGTSLVDLETFELEDELLELARGSQEKKTRVPIPDQTEQRKHGPAKDKKKEKKKARGFGRSKR